MKALFSLILLLLLSNISTKTKQEWKSRSIYQIITDRFARSTDTGVCNYSKYCGGNYRGIINKLDYIKGMGFDAIWISPIIENTPDSYHGYHLTNLYALNTHFGSENDLKNLITQCHNKDIWVMVDVVANHVGPVGTDYSKITPFNKAEHYHDWCDITDFTNQWQVENCRLCELPDLKQENDWVTEQLVNWIKDIVQKYNFDGIRIDTIMEVPKWFWDKFREAAGVFQIGEAFDGRVEYVADYQNHLDSVFNYPLHWTIKDSFCGSFRNLEGYWLYSRNKFPAPEYMSVFVENTDNSSLSSFYSTNKNKNIINQKKVEKKASTGLLKIIAEVLEDICEQSKIKNDENLFLVKSFMTKKRPNISIYDFLTRLYKYSKVSENILILVLIYIDRLCHNRKICLNYFNIHKLILASFVTAIKFVSDEFYSLEFYSKLGGISQKEIILLEYEFIVLLDFKLFVDEKLYEKYENNLRNAEMDDDEDCDYDSDG